MDRPRIERITAHAALSDGVEELREAAVWAAEGDADWQAWLDDRAAGLAVIVRLDVVAEIRGVAGAGKRVHCAGRSIWIEKSVDVPYVQEQLRQLAGNHFGDLAARLGQAGVPVAESDLEQMYVEVRLDRSLSDELTTEPTLDRGATLSSEREPPCE